MRTAIARRRGLSHPLLYLFTTTLSRDVIHPLLSLIIHYNLPRDVESRGEQGVLIRESDGRTDSCLFTQAPVSPTGSCHSRALSLPSSEAEQRLRAVDRTVSGSNPTELCKLRYFICLIIRLSTFFFCN